MSEKGHIESGRLPKKVVGISSHVFEDHLLIFSEPAQKLYQLNNTAAVIWCHYEDQRSFDEIVDVLVNSYGLSKTKASEDLNKIIREWIALGLLAGERSGDGSLGHNEAAPHGNPVDLPTGDMDSENSGFRFNLAGQGFLFRSNDNEIESSIANVFAHLAADSLSRAVNIDVVDSNGTCSIYCTGRLTVSDIPREHIVGALTQTVLGIAYRQCDFLIAVHGAVLGIQRKCLILPGQSGIGKTTLAAALIRGGFEYFTDEVALLDRSTRTIIPAPVSLRVKEGAWEEVSAMFPHFGQLPWYSLSTGDRVRYLPPPPGGFASRVGDGYPVRWVIFSRYCPDSETTISSINRIEALNRLQSVGYDVGGHLDRMKVIELLEWIGTVDCYDMKINRLDDGVKAIRGLCC